MVIPDFSFILVVTTKHKYNKVMVYLRYLDQIGNRIPKHPLAEKVESDDLWRAHKRNGNHM